MFNPFGNKSSSLSMDQAVQELSRNPAIRLIDVRTPEEFKEGHIPGSISLPLNSIQNAEKLLPDKNTQLYVCCLSGARSRSASAMLVRMGYTKVTDIGGIQRYHGRMEK